MNYLIAVSNFFPDNPSGSARVAWDIAQIMRDRGHNVYALQIHKSKYDIETVHMSGKDIERLSEGDNYGK